MKALIALALLTIPTANAATLVKADRMPGFEAKPQHKEFVLDTDGKMTMTVESYRDQKKEVVLLGQLSKETVAKIVAQVNQIDDNAQLEDPRKGEPMCMDAPSFSVSVFKGAKEIVVQTRANCHKAEISYYPAEEIAGFANLFLNL